MSLKPVADLLTSNGVAFDDVMSDQFSTYLTSLLHFNRSMNLIGPMDEASIVKTLFVDSLVPGVIAPPSGCVLDVGSGAGFPGIPLAIVFSDATYTLIEPRKKRANFLRIMKTKLKLDHVSVHECRLEEFEKKSFDYLISKAFRPPKEWIEIAREWAEPDGQIICMHAGELEDGESHPVAGYADVPGDVERFVTVIPN